MIGDASTESHARLAARRIQVNRALCHSFFFGAVPSDVGIPGNFV